MEQLYELEKRVLDIIQKNKDLHEENSRLKADNGKLQEQCRYLESSVLNENKNSKALEVEKAAIKTTVEELLETINSLGSSK